MPARDPPMPHRLRRSPLARTRSLAVGLALGAPIAAALAQSPAAAADGTTTSVAAAAAQALPLVEVRGAYVNGVGSADAASAGTVTATLIESRPTLRPAELLEFVPGVIVTQHSGDGKANQYYLRGFNLDHGTDFAAFVDAMPVNMPTHAHGQGYADLNWLIPELVERIRTARDRMRPRTATSPRPARRASAWSTRCRTESRRRPSVPTATPACCSPIRARSPRAGGCTRSKARTTTGRGASRRSSIARTACCAIRSAARRRRRR